MELLEELYVGGSVGDLSTILYSLKRGIPVFHLYCICILKEETEKIVLLPSWVLLSPREKNRPYTVTGIAHGKEEAYSLLEYIGADAVKNGRDITTIRGFFG